MANGLICQSRLPDYPTLTYQAHHEAGLLLTAFVSLCVLQGHLPCYALNIRLPTFTCWSPHSGSLDYGYVEATEKGNLVKNRHLSGPLINIWDVQAAQGGSCARAQKMAITYKLRRETPGGPSPASCCHVCQEMCFRLSSCWVCGVCHSAEAC